MVTEPHIVTEEDRERLGAALVPLRGQVLCESMYTAWQLLIASARADQVQAQSALQVASARLHKLRDLFVAQNVPPPERRAGELTIKFVPHNESATCIASLNTTLRMMCPGAIASNEGTDENKRWVIRLPPATHVPYMRWALEHQGYVKQVLPD